jgi:hypothetical protein
VKVVMSVSGLKSRFFAVRNQYGEPVSWSKCHAIAARRYASESEGGILRGKCSNDKSTSAMGPILSYFARRSCKVIGW